MPPNQKPSKGTLPNKVLTEAQVRKIWTEVKPAALSERLRMIQPGARWSFSGARVIGCCPYHEDKTPSFHIYLDRGYAKCYGCDRFVWNPIDLWSQITGNPKSAALAELRQLFGLTFLGAAAQGLLDRWERHQLLKRRISALCHEELVNAITQPKDPKYEGAQSAVDYLLNTRKIPQEAVPALTMLGILPPLARVLEAFDLEAEAENQKRLLKAVEDQTKVELFTSLANEAKEYLEGMANWVGAVSFRLDSTPDTVSRIKLRRPKTKDFSVINDPYEETLGLFGLGWGQYTPLLGNSQLYGRPYIVEGEFDALSIMARQVVAGSTSLLILSAGGGAGGSGDIGSLHALGFDEVCLVSDAPDKSGEQLIEIWLPTIKELRTKIFTGYNRFPGAGDPDEMVLRYGLDQVQAALLAVNDSELFQNPQDWVFFKAQTELDVIAPQDIRHMIDVAGTWGRLIKNRVESEAYVEHCRAAYNISVTQLKREIASREEDEPAFILRVVSVLQEIFYIVGQRSTDVDRTLLLWHKEKKRAVTVALADDNSIERELGPLLGTSYQLFQDRIGVPRFLEPSEVEKEGGKYLQKRDRDYRWYLRQALIQLAQEAIDIDAAKQMSQGFHVLRGDEDVPTHIYLVNGRDVYCGTPTPEGKPTWEQLPGPSHNGIIFDVGKRAATAPWLPWVKSTDDLAKAETLNPLEIYQKLHKAIDIGWRYKNHNITTDFLAAHLMATTVCAAFRRQVMVAFHADTKAGKSRMVMGLIGGQDFPRIHLMANAFGMASYTAAGIRQGMNNRTRALCLDEFEDDGSGDKKSRTTREVLEMFRNLLGENNDRTQGSRSNDAVQFRLNFFVFVAAIHKARRAEDANRMITIFMERAENKQDPVLALMQAFGVRGLAQLKQDLSLVMAPRIPEIHKNFTDIESELGQPGVKPTGIDSRVYEALYPALAIMKTLGLDYRKFVDDFCEANKEGLILSNNHTNSMALFYWLANTANLTIRSHDRNEHNDASVLQLLQTPDTREDINRSGSGLFWDEPTKALVVNWTTAIQKVLSGHAQYGKETNVLNIRELANRAPHAMTTTELEASGALQRLKAHGLVGVSAQYLTAYHMGHILQEMQDGVKDDRSPVEHTSPRQTTVRKNDAFHG